MESENPDIQWALDLLKPDPLVKKDLIAQYWHQIPVFTAVPGAVYFTNYRRGLPFYSRPHYYALFVGLAYGASMIADHIYASRTAETDSIIRDYIIRHPEDFPPPERKKYGELFTKWVPIR